MKLLPCRFCGTAPNAAISVVPAADRHYARHVCMGPYHTTMETAAAEWNAANAPADPAPLALAKFGATVVRSCIGRQEPLTMDDVLECGWQSGICVGSTGRLVTPNVHETIARLLAPDGAGSEVPS